MNIHGTNRDSDRAELLDDFIFFLRLLSNHSEACAFIEPKQTHQQKRD
jgi:hypothetical protein